MEKKSFFRHLPTIARILMGLMFFVFGLNGFLDFIPKPKEPMPEAAVAFAGALMKTGYMMPLVMGTQLIVGALLLLNRFVPLALALRRRDGARRRDRAHHYWHRCVPRLPRAVGPWNSRGCSRFGALPRVGVSEGVWSHARDANHTGRELSRNSAAYLPRNNEFLHVRFPAQETM